MILRPSTPLSVVLIGAFALLLLATLSTPIIKGIPLGTNNGITYGVFGFCKDDGSCSSIGIGYDTGGISDKDSKTFDLSPSIRNTLSAILVVHPVAALLTLVMFVMAVASHFHAPSHSARYLLILFIFTVIDFLVCLLAFLVDILLFIPHMAWGTYIVLAATILVAIGGLVSCAMRRTLVSRKARKKRIAENAEMSGENYYNREAHTKATVDVSSQPTIPLVSGGNSGANDKLPAFASFNNRKDDQVSDERVPLTQLSPVDRSPSTGPNEVRNIGDGPGSFGSPSRSQSRDRYGNPIGQAQNEYGMTRMPSGERMNGRGRGDMRQNPGYRGGRGGYGRGGYDGYGPTRGRGGYGPPGRGGYGPRGGRGGYGPPPRGAYGPGGMRGGRTPPPGYGNYAGSYDGRQQMDAYDAYGQGPPDAAPGYNSNPGANTSMPSLNPSMPSSSGDHDPYNQGTQNMGGLPRAESPPPLAGSEHATSSHGQAVEMDGTPTEVPKGFGQFGPLRDSDADVAGMVGLQQGRAPGRHDTYMSEGSKYSQDEQYLPARIAWNQGSGRNSPQVPSPLNIQNRSAAEPAQRRTDTPPVAPAGSGNYYEDVDPRYAEPSSSAYHQTPAEPVYEDVHATAGGSRSPVGSEKSNFTSISQRGVNPRWNAPPPMPQYSGHHPPGHPPSRRQAQQRQDVLLDNPDFQVGGGSSAGGTRRGGPGMIPGSAYPTGSV